MKHKFLYIFALAGMLLGSCAVEETPSVGGSILAEMETDDTRTSVTDSGKFTWSSGDQIWLHTTSGSALGTLSDGAGTSSAKFTYGYCVGEMTGNAVYPYNAGHSISGDVLNVVMPSSYNLGSLLDNNNAVMYGINVGGTLKFKHMAGVMRFKFKNVPAGTDTFKITLDKKINGTFCADLTAEYPVLQTEDTAVDAEKTITLKFDALTSTSDINLYIPLPLGTYTSIGLALLSGENSVWTYSNTVTNSINRKTLKLMPVISMDGSVGGEIEGEEPDAIDLSSSGTANSYIVSAAGSYKFTPTKGNSSQSVETIASADVLWETFGTDVTPNVGDLINNVKFENSVISFETASTYTEGNAVIAAKDASGNILWSWHIWLTDQPEGQEYYNNAGTMMDRNLGATSATPGDVGALGLLYQWGRKDPFLGSSSISTSIEAKSTIVWPSSVNSNSINGAIAGALVQYAIANPTTFILGGTINFDWFYTGYPVTDNTRWTTSSDSKSIYDPCPAGWRIPNGGKNGVWSKAIGSSSDYYCTYDENNEGVNFSGKFGSAPTIWYPASGRRYFNYGGLEAAGGYSYYWSASPSSATEYLAYNLSFGKYEYIASGDNCHIWPSEDDYRAGGQSVRCVQE